MLNFVLLVARYNHFSGFFWLFCLNVLRGGGEQRMMVCLKNECSLSGGGNQPLLAVLKKSNFLHSQII